MSVTDQTVQVFDAFQCILAARFSVLGDPFIESKLFLQDLSPSADGPLLLEVLKSLGAGEKIWAGPKITKL